MAAEPKQQDGGGNRAVIFLAVAFVASMLVTALILLFGK